ncbi:hypothetical protein FQR65_LT04456 [Abscondita terminalis]|nr:hypothetical protein FQR65_LT04456 [Abscondita terminalis]
MKVAIIGAGVAGIVSLKYALEKGHECDCFEETGEFGGTWVYTDENGEHENGSKIYRSMYKDLITNLPKDVMVFMDFPYPEHVKESFISQQQVLQYLTDYVNYFKLNSHIKYNETVTKVQPLPDNKWKVTTQKSENLSAYDAVFVCNGHFRYPKFPKIVGQELFTGFQIHSAEYRDRRLFRDKQVLIIGASYSGTDIACQLKDMARTVYLSHWKPINIKIENVLNKPAVELFEFKNVVFADGSIENIDAVIYCTGYEYRLPFLDESCGITIKNNWVQPLYKHIINIEHPTMFIIGYPHSLPSFLASDLQARFSLTVLENKNLLPSKENMLKDLNDYLCNLRRKNIPQTQFHKVELGLEKYFAELVKISGIKHFPPVLLKLYMHKIKNPGKDDKLYKILDDENYITCSTISSLSK